MQMERLVFGIKENRQGKILRFGLVSNRLQAGDEKREAVFGPDLTGTKARSYVTNESAEIAASRVFIQMRQRTFIRDSCYYASLVPATPYFHYRETAGRIHMSGCLIRMS
ncbi:hypothetical protein GCM10007362_27220 [Saccharibacillus endophyticus]|uniref:Uncharacterized protein n=1 Tax=Saccharibacillus endophyticus TaxID=2060666 RepID=A0ABQ1ZXC6_9BACL|nr:hypothetical protein GCM10007362_27220 [Saccharibacillus endophyticus]